MLFQKSCTVWKILKKLRWALLISLLVTIKSLNLAAGVWGQIIGVSGKKGVERCVVFESRSLFGI